MNFLLLHLASILSSVVAQKILMGVVSGLSLGQSTILKMVLTAPPPVLVIVSLRKRVYLDHKKGAAHTLNNGSIDKSDVIQMTGCLIE